MTKRDARQLGKGLAFISPWLIGFLLFMLLPIVLSFKYSLSEYSLLQPPMYIGLDNYREMYRDPIFWQSIRNSLYYAALVIPSSLLFSLGLAMLLNVKMPGQGIFRTIIFLPSLVPIVAAAMCWMWLYNGKSGMINYFLDPVLANVGPWINWAFDWTLNPLMSVVNWAMDRSLNPLLEWFDFAPREIPHLYVITAAPAWLGDPNWTLPALALMSLWGVGYTVVIYLAGLQDVPRELYEAAEIDGAGIWGRLWHVTIPVLSPVIFFNLVMSIIGVLQVFDLPYIMTPNGGPARSTVLMAVYLYDNAFRFVRMGYASAIAWIMLLMILALTGLAFWSSKRWVHYQGK